MLSWFIVITLIASVCSAGMGVAWLLGVRGLRTLWWVSASTGAVTAAIFSASGGGARDQIMTGAAYGVAIGIAVWLILWVGVRPFLGTIDSGRIHKNSD